MDIRRRDPNRFSKILEARNARASQQRSPIEVIPHVVIPKAASRNAALSRPRRPKGVPKSRRAP